MKPKQFFRREFRTSDHETDPNLIIHHYRNDYNAILKGLRAMALELGYLEVSYDEHYHEIQFLSVNTKVELIVTIMVVSSYEHAIGFVLNTFYGLSLGRAYRRVKMIYPILNKYLVNLKQGIQ